MGSEALMTVTKGDNESVFTGGWWVSPASRNRLPIGAAVSRPNVTLTIRQPRVTLTVRGALP